MDEGAKQANQKMYENSVKSSLQAIIKLLKSIDERLAELTERPI